MCAGILAGVAGLAPTARADDESEGGGVQVGRIPVVEVGVRVRKPAVQLGGPLDYAGVEIWRSHSPG